MGGARAVRRATRHPAEVRLLLRASCPLEDARHELPPVNHFGRPQDAATASDDLQAEIDRLIEAALRLRPKGGLRPWTYATLIARCSQLPDYRSLKL